MNQELLERVLQSPRLPSLPSIALQVIQLVQRADVNVKQIAEVIQRDPALAGKLLKIVNSSFYGQPKTISTISQAVIVLGLNAVKTLALGFSLVADLKEQCDDHLDHMLFWKRSLYGATAARHLARQMGLAQQEEAFLGGLLQDLGVMAMSQVLGAEYARLVRQAENPHAALLANEREAFDLDHAVVGAALAESWSLPNILVQLVRCHETPEQVESEELAPLVHAVALGALIAEAFVAEEPNAALAAFHEQLGKTQLELPQTPEQLLRTVHDESIEMRRLFDLPTGELNRPGEILSRANETMLRLSLQTQQQAVELQKQNRQLAAQLTTDSLTGVANRRKFNSFLSEQFDYATETGQPLSILFLDTDNFKQFNDRYGHQTGDRVLIELASLLQDQTPEGGLVARYGGEEFAIVLTDTDRRGAARMAEAIRKALQNLTVQSDQQQPLHITVSIGAATHTGDFFQRVEQLLKAADQAVYAAKAAGRNCVRIFTPRQPALVKDTAHAGEGI